MEISLSMLKAMEKSVGFPTEIKIITSDHEFSYYDGTTLRMETNIDGRMFYHETLINHSDIRTPVVYIMESMVRRMQKSAFDYFFNS